MGNRSRGGWLLVGVLAVVESYVALSAPAGRRLSDLDVYMGAVTSLRDGHGLYSYLTPGGLPFTYPPIAGLIFLPLTYLGRFPLDVAWTAATVAVVIGLAVLLARLTGRHPAWIAAVLLVSAPVTSDLGFGQVSVGLAALVTVDVVVLRHSRFSGVLVGVAAAVKLTPLLFIPMLWVAGRRRAATVAASVFAACAAVAFAAVPGESWRFWTGDMWHVERLGAITSHGNQSFNGAMLRLGIPDGMRSPVMVVVGVAVAVLALRRAARAGRHGDWLSAAVVTGAASVVVSPVSWTHHQVWLVIAALLPVQGSSRVRAGWAWAVLAVMILPLTTIGGHLGGVAEVVLGDARLLLAVCVACVVPLRSAPLRSAVRRSVVRRSVVRRDAVVAAPARGDLAATPT